MCFIQILKKKYEKSVSIYGRNYKRYAPLRQEKENTRSQGPRAFVPLLAAEGLAVGALVHGGVCLVGADQDPVQGTVVLVGAVMGALLYGTFDGLVSMTIHKKSSFIIGVRHYYGEPTQKYAGNPWNSANQFFR